MLNDKIIYFIYADNCPDCENMRRIILNAIKDSQIPLKLEEVSSDTERAIQLSLDNNIDDLPGCIIGDFSFCGKGNYSYCDIIDAIERTWKTLKK